jgi:TonB-linked SusC/RagA family outer membrane protein
MEKLLRTCFVCMFFVWVSTSVFAQQRIIKGTVTDETGMSMPGVTVKIKGASGGTQTSRDGKYSIAVPSVNTILVFTFIGYDAQELSTKSSTTLNLSMSTKAGSLDEVVVVAFGSQKKVNVTGAIGQVSPADLVATPISNISNMLVGQVAGVTALQTSGEPGRNEATIHVRGVATFSTGNNASNPLVVIDGIEQATETGFVQLNAMDANEIASVSILKDATSTAVYGIRAANGVIVVTTKRGKTGKPQLSLSTNFGSTQTNNLQKDVTSLEWATMRNEAINTAINDLGNTSYNSRLFTADDLWKFANNRDYTPAEVAAMSLTDAQKAQLNASPALYYGSHDIYKDIFGGKGPQSQLNLNISGGTEKVKYFTSFGTFSQGSVMKNTSYYGANTGSTYNRYNFRTNFDIQAIKNVKIAVNVASEFGKTVGAGGNSGTQALANRYQAMLQYIYDGNPYVQPGIIDNHLINQIAGVAGSADNPLGIKSGSQIGAQNAVYNLLASGIQTVYSTLLSNSMVVTHTMDYLTKGLSVSATAGFDEYYTNGSNFSPSLPTYSIRRNPQNPNNYDYFGGQIGANGFNSNLGSALSTWHKSYFDAGFNYARTYGDHAITGLLVGKANTYSLPSDANNTPSGVIGFLGRVTYNFKDRYNLEYDMGYNGTSQFIEGKRFGFFPAYSAAWVASNESFFPKNKIVTFLKVRGSTGQVGNDNIGGRRYLYFPNSYSQNQTNQNGNNQGYYLGTSNGSVQNPYYSGTSEGAIGNPAVTWERSTKTNIGLDARFLSDKLSLTVDVFKEDRNNILTTLGTIPTTYGVSSSNVPPVNVGVTTNHGYEASLTYADKVGKLGYSIGTYVAYYKNKIIYKAEAPNPYYWQNQTGFLINQNFGLVSDGFFNTPQDLATRPFNSFTNNQAVLGDIRYKDLNGDGIIDNKDQAPIGFARDPLYSYNLKLSLNYKGIDISALFIGTANGSFYENPGLAIPFFKVAGNAWQWEYDGRWTPQKAASGATITYPRATIDNSASSNDFLKSDFWLISNNFKRLKNLEVGYTIPSNKFFKKAKINAVRVYANGNNLFTWDAPLKKYGIDPETSDSAGTFIFPVTSVFSFGASVKF